MSNSGLFRHTGDAGDGILPAVSGDRLELVRQGFDAWNKEDPQWVLKHMSPEVEWVTPDTDPYPGTYRGYQGVQEFWSRWRSAVGKLNFAVEEMIDGGQHVVVIARRWARNEQTGLRVDDKIAQVFTFDQDDVCIRVEEFHGREAAMEAAGLTAEDAR
jgi:ketosteroid isomerase-like protein